LLFKWQQFQPRKFVRALWGNSDEP
jgi:hypothetical protein